MHICKANTAREKTRRQMATNKSNETTVRALLKCPDKDPEIIEIEFPFRMSNDDSEFNETVFSIIKAENATSVEKSDYSATISMFYSHDVPEYNFGIAYHVFYGNVLFIKCRRHHSVTTGTATYDLTDSEIKRICAAMGWVNPLGKGSKVK